MNKISKTTLYQFLVIFLFLSLSIGTALLICYYARPWSPTELTLTLLHTNDVHSRRKEFNKDYNDCKLEELKAGACFGGAARQLHMIEKIRAESPYPVLLFDAGDQFQGTFYYNYYKGSLTAEIMNRMQYTGMAFGNHEFDDGIQKLEDFVKRVNFPVLCANIDVSFYPDFAKSTKPYVIYPEHSLGVIGYITPDTSALANAALPNTHFLPPVPAVQNVVDELRAKGIRRIIAVCHNGYNEDLEVAAQTEGLNLIIGGHSHTLLDKFGESNDGDTGYYPTKIINKAGKPTYVVQASWAGKYLGNLNITWSTETDELTSIQGLPILLDNSVPKHNEMEEFVMERGQPFKHLDKIVGSAAGEFPYCVLRQDCEMANLVADAVLAHLPEVELFVITAGCMRSSFGQGAISLLDILAVFPFGSHIVEKMVDGQFIVDIVENALAMRNLQSKKFITSTPYFGNARVTYKKRKAEGKRIVKLEIGIRGTHPVVYKPIDVKRKYQFSTIDFIATGGDHLVPRVLKDVTKREDIAVVFEEYIKTNSPVLPHLNPQMINLEGGHKRS